MRRRKTPGHSLPGGWDNGGEREREESERERERGE